MIINHPLLGPRDAAEFTILGDATLLERPNWQAKEANEAFYEYLYLRDNPVGLHHELWFHEQGDRSWLVVTRDTVTHAVLSVALASDLVLSSKFKTSKASAKQKVRKLLDPSKVLKAGTKKRPTKRNNSKDHPK